MGYDKREYEKLITDSPLFSLDKKEEETAFKREERKMVGYLYCYLMAVKARDYEPYGMEITEVALRCIRNFDVSKGVFLHYFTSAWKQEFLRCRGDKALDQELHGLKVSEEEKRAIKRLARFKQRGIERDDVQKEATEAGLLKGDVDMGFLSIETLFISETDAEDGSEELSRLCKLQGQEADPLKQILEKQAADNILRKIDAEFQDLQERQKPIISDLLTIKICSVCKDCYSYSFINMEMVNNWEKTGDFPTQRDIACKYGRDEASISRTYNKFIQTLVKMNKA